MFVTLLFSTLRFILKDRITFISSYSDFKEISAQHIQFILVYTVDAVNDGRDMIVCVYVHGWEAH